MIKNIKIQNIFDIIEISESMERDKFIYEKICLNVSYDCSKFDGSRKNKM
jgi:hypothetical protein